VTSTHKIPDILNVVKSSAPYSYVVQHGNMLYVSGITGMNYEKGELAGSDFESQARQAFVNISIECVAYID
jgi:enamine deaminase RidA (YjgF/YER057c/UK114 family)